MPSKEKAKKLGLHLNIAEMVWIQVTTRNGNKLD